MVTTRNHSLAFEPAETGIEIAPFDTDVGSRFLLHLLSLNIAQDLSTGEVKSAHELAEKLSGHALGISQMAGLIYRQSWSIQEFLAIYNKNTRKVHEISGGNSLGAVWQLSFESLDPEWRILRSSVVHFTRRDPTGFV